MLWLSLKKRFKGCKICRKVLSYVIICIFINNLKYLIAFCFFNLSFLFRWWFVSWNKWFKTCVNGHLWTTATCLQWPSWAPIFQKFIEINCEKRPGMPWTLNKGCFFGVSRGAVVVRFDCILNSSIILIIFFLIMWHFWFKNYNCNLIFITSVTITSTKSRK